MFCLPLKLTFVGNRGFSYFIYSERQNKKVRKTAIFDLTATIKGNSVDFFCYGENIGLLQNENSLPFCGAYSN